MKNLIIIFLLITTSAFSQTPMPGMRGHANRNTPYPLMAIGGQGETGGLQVTNLNPTTCGQGVSFGSPTDCGVGSGLYQWTDVDGNATKPLNGSLFNYRVNSGYYALGFPTFVGGNFELQVNDNAFAGNDLWALLGILDLQGTSGNLGGQATAGIIRGNLSGGGLAAGIRSQAENYSGRAGFGIIVGSSQTDGAGLPFDNSYDTGLAIEDSHTYGITICQTGHICPGIPILVRNGTGAALMQVDGLGGLKVGDNNTTGAVPTCNAAATGTFYFVVDATSVSYHATYAGGGSGRVAIVCTGSIWIVI